MQNVTEYFIHNVDRWPSTGAYGDNYIYVDGKHHAINECDVENKVITTKSGISYNLGENQPNYDLFYKVVGMQWDVLYKEMWKGDEDYTDYVPLFYRTLENFKNRKGEWYNK